MFSTCSIVCNQKIILSIRFSGSEWRSSVRTPSETLESASSYTRKKGVRAIHLEARCFRGYRKSLRLFCGYSSRRFSSVSSLLLHGLKSPYDFLNFNGDFTTIETARKRSVERLSNAQARCQLWNLRRSHNNYCELRGWCMWRRGARPVCVDLCLQGAPPPTLN